MRPNIAALLLLAAALALSSCVDTSKAPQLECTIESTVSVPGDWTWIIVLPTGERIFMHSNGNVLLPPLPASKVER